MEKPLRPDPAPTMMTCDCSPDAVKDSTDVSALFGVPGYNVLPLDTARWYAAPSSSSRQRWIYPGGRERSCRTRRRGPNAATAGRSRNPPDPRQLRIAPRDGQASRGAASEAFTAASTCKRVVGNTATGLSAAEISSSISVQPSTTPSAPAATKRPMTSR